MKATLRKKRLKDGRQRLYLDFYPAIPHPDTGKLTRREFLKLYLYDKPKTEAERTHNKETKILADAICAKRQLQIQSGNYDFLAKDTGNENFLHFFKEQVEKRAKSKRNHQHWRSTYLHLHRFTEGKLLFRQVNRAFCESLKEYFLDTTHLNGPRPLHQNSAAGYFDIFKEAIAKAHELRLLKENVALYVKSIPQIETEREFLTYEEVQALVKADCIDPVLKRAGLFSAFTGLRFSDIKDMTWHEVRHSHEHGHFLRFTISKAGRPDTQFISEQAAHFLGERGDPEEQVFKGLKYGNHISTWLNEWGSHAGIDRRFTFHAFRHTFATLQLTFGTDIYTIKELLGQKNVQTTQVYVHMLNQKKKEAVDRIPKIDLE